MKISLLLDNPLSWFGPYAERIQEWLIAEGHEVEQRSEADDISDGDCAFFLSCEHKVGAEIRARNAHNIVVHSSALPKGRGWSPLTWQVLEGEKEITTCLFEAVDAVDAGPVYGRATFRLEGHELLDELHTKQGRAIVDLVLMFVRNYPPGRGEEQIDQPTFYSRRTAEASELDPAMTLAEQFDLLRVCDNDAYPAFFEHRGHRYTLTIHDQGAI